MTPSSKLHLDVGFDSVVVRTVDLYPGDPSSNLADLKTFEGMTHTAESQSPTGPSQDQPTTPDDGQRINWSKRCGNNNPKDGDESPTNISIRNTPRLNHSEQLT